MFCSYYNCNELILESVNLGNNIFLSKWYEQSLSIKRSLIIVIIRSQTPLELRIANLYTISNDLTVGFVKAGFTYVLLSRFDFQ
uniref:Odorant receptor 32 n=1 Tax=Apriona germarii TaxID=157307 RepID=A0A7G7WND0_APRGE|nr:odorant receptor 32 [Apriona germarii]